MPPNDAPHFGLAPRPRGSFTLPTGGLPLPGGGQGPTRDEQRSLDEYRRQQLVMQLQARKAALGMEALATVHAHASVAWSHTVEAVVAVKEQRRGTEAQKWVDEFSTRQLELAGQQLLGLLDVAGTAIAYEVNRELHFDAPKRSFFARLFNVEEE